MSIENTRKMFWNNEVFIRRKKLVIEAQKISLIIMLIMVSLPKVDSSTSDCAIMYVRYKHAVQSHGELPEKYIPIQI